LRVSFVPLASRSLRASLVALCLLAVSACSGATAATGSGPVSFAPDARKVAPDLSGTTIRKGDQFSLAGHRGQVVVVNYWASWCDPCRDEVPALQQLYDDFSPQVTFIGVSFHGDTKTAATAFLKGLKVPYDSLSDPDSKTVLAFRGKVTIGGPPLTLVIDKHGRIADVINGVVVYSQLRDKIQEEQAAA
jgi:thiol-disulfide isomerase/thioredoxin